MKIKLGSLMVEYDRNYGIDRRTGWSVAWLGSYVSILQPSLPKALWELKEIRHWTK
jgi:hypothetical protein